MKTILVGMAVGMWVAAPWCGGQEKEWDRRFGGGGQDTGQGVWATADGGYLLGGSSFSGADGDKTEASRGMQDDWIVKLDGSGVKQWDRRYGGDHVDGLNSLRATADGGYILGGYSRSGANGDQSEGSRGGYDYWVVKVDSSGAKQWDRRFGGSQDEELYAIELTADGGYLLGGSSYSGAGGDKTQGSRGGADIWVVKVNAVGTKQWDRRFGGSQDDECRAIAATPDGGFLLGGGSYSGINGDRTEDSRGGADFWVVKINANGKKQWDRRFGGAAGDWLNAIRATPDGGFLLAGESASGAEGDKSQASRGGMDYWVVKVTAAGVKQWDRRFGGSNGDHLFDARETLDGGYVLAGRSDSGAGGDKTEDSRGSSDVWVVKTDARGYKRWDRRFGGDAYESAYGLIQTADGGYLLAGETISGIGGDVTEDHRGDYDCWLVKLAGRLPDGYEPDDTQGTAPRITNGQAQSRSIHEIRDRDWARMAVGRGGARNVVVETAGTAGDTVLSIYKGGSGALVGQNDDISLDNRFSRIAIPTLASGTYFIKVEDYANNDAIAAYTLRARWTQLLAPDAYENDNVRSSAKVIRNGQTQRRNIHRAGNRDWVKFTVGGRGGRNLLVETRGSSGDTQMWVYDRAVRRVAFDDDSGPGRFSRVTASAVPAGTYYIRIQEKGNNGTIPLYSLKVRWTAR